VRDDRERLLDILEAAQKIAERVLRGRARFDAEEDLQIVLTHLVQIIGEAAARLGPETTAASPEIPWRRITGMRHRVVHDYFAVDLDILWAAATIDIPDLAEKIRVILDRIEAGLRKERP
jgi:uncharacterized protein with HEPN domain